MPKIDPDKEMQADGYESGGKYLPKKRPMFCDVCKCTDIRTVHDVGADIDEEGEERQHEDVCKGCGATRLWADRFSFEDGPYVWWEQFRKDTHGYSPWY